MLAAYSSGETALALPSTATSISARPLISRNSTTLVPNSDWGSSTALQSAARPIAKRPCGSFHIARSLDPTADASVASLVGLGVGAGVASVACFGTAVAAEATVPTG